MKWRKLGKIFDPADHELPMECKTFAQSPQALVFPDFIRVFFSTRRVDGSGKYLSHVAFVDYDKSFSKILRVSQKPVIPLGELGCFDEHGIFPVNVLHDGDKILAYTTGWNRRVSVSADASIGLAVSTNGGESFQKFGHGPVMAASWNEPFLVSDAFVLKVAGKYEMWYLFGVRWIDETPEGDPQRVYKIAHATSDDGINWIRDGKCIIPDRLGDTECQALPTVTHFGNRWHMYFCYRHATGFRKDVTRGYRLGYAWSVDGKHWTRDDVLGGFELSPEGWDSEMNCYPNIFQSDGKLFMLYNGNEFGKAGFGLAQCVT